MLSFGWGEILLVLVVVIVVVGPKDLPKLIKQFSTYFIMVFWKSPKGMTLKTGNLESNYSLNHLQYSMIKTEHLKNPTANGHILLMTQPTILINIIENLIN